MNIYRLQRHIDVVLAALDTGQDLIKFIFVLSRGYRQVADTLAQAVHDQNRTAFSRKQLEVLERFVEFRKHAEKFSIGGIFHEIIQFKQALAELETTGDEETENLLTMLPGNIDEFYEVLEQFVKTGKDDAFTALMAEAHHLYPILITARRAFHAVRTLSQQDEHTEPQVGQRDFSLTFEAAASYETRLRKLLAIEHGYQALADLIEVDTEAHPLEINRLETEGRQVCVRGEAQTLNLFSALLHRFAMFLYHRCSLPSTGSIPERVIATQSLINLADELELAGLSEAAEDERLLKQTALVLRREFTILLAGDPVLHIDGQGLAVDEGAHERYIEISNDLVTLRAEQAVPA